MGVRAINTPHTLTPQHAPSLSLSLSLSLVTGDLRLDDLAPPPPCPCRPNPRRLGVPAGSAPAAVPLLVR
jgi:hypothetical protein